MLDDKIDSAGAAKMSSRYHSCWLQLLLAVDLASLSECAGGHLEGERRPRLPAWAAFGGRAVPSARTVPNIPSAIHRGPATPFRQAFRRTGTAVLSMMRCEWMDSFAF